jgi:hypothetical protein
MHSLRDAAMLLSYHPSLFTRNQVSLHFAGDACHGGEDFVDVRRYQGIVGNPGVAHDPSRVEHEDGSFADAVVAFSMTLVRRVHDAELLHDLAVEVAQQRERQIELFGKRCVGTAALDA